MNDIVEMTAMGLRTKKIIEENYNFISVDSKMGFWDICASDAICREVGGGCVSLKSGSLLGYKGNLRSKVSKDFLLGNNAAALKKFILENSTMLGLL
jgi:fructose-1,6-bisphosphatase/inositol monophosphatase family enzyme